MGRPEKLSKEQQAEAVAKVKMHGGRAAVCLEYGISEVTLMRYMKQATQAVSENDIQRGEEPAKEPATWLATMEPRNKDYMRGLETEKEMAATRKPDEPPMPEAA